MIKLTIGRREVKLPFSVKLYDVSLRKFEELAGDDIRAEFLDGVMMAYSPSSSPEQRLADFLRSLMGSYVAERDLGRVLAPDVRVHLTNRQRVLPDVSFVRQQPRRQRITPRSFRGAPDLVMEVVSPLKPRWFLHNKSLAFYAAKIREIWAVSMIEQVVIIDRLRKTRYNTSCISRGRASSTVIPGFWVDVAWLWKDELPEQQACLRAILS
jgi:Uma2 family endonuclease